MVEPPEHQMEWLSRAKIHVGQFTSRKPHLRSPATSVSVSSRVQPELSPPTTALPPMRPYTPIAPQRREPLKYPMNSITICQVSRWHKTSTKYNCHAIDFGGFVRTIALMQRELVRFKRKAIRLGGSRRSGGEEHNDRGEAMSPTLLCRSNCEYLRIL